MHAILYADNPSTILFGRPGKDAGQDARTADGITVYQSKYRNGLDMDEAIKLALEELDKIKEYRAAGHANHEHWKAAQQWVLFANLSINPNDDAKWKSKVVPAFKKEGLVADYWSIEIIEGKLAAKPEVRDVFFGQENRVLVGLKEAHDLLKNERFGSVGPDTAFIGREAELKRVKEFAGSKDKRLLPVIGPGGIGKSRFVYESLVILSQEGWRVLWALPGAMAKSSQWFRLLNGNQKTCVVLDDPDNPGLLREVIEQLSTGERRNWRVILSCRTANAESLRRYKANANVDEAIQLNALNEQDSKTLVTNYLGQDADPAWLHRIFRFTNGNPGWLCLIADLARNGKLAELPPTSDDIASLYVNASLEKLDPESSRRARVLLKWMSLWGTFVLEAGNDERPEIALLDHESIPKAVLGDLLRTLVDVGLVRNWGVGKRLYGVEPLIVRQHILVEWLLRTDADGGVSVSPSGVDLVKRLVAEGLPSLDSTLQTISQLAISRLNEQDAYSLLQPIFKELAAAAVPATLVTQNHIADLTMKLGPADPESALDVLIAVRKNMKEDQEVEHSFWGKVTFGRRTLLSTLSWTLFNLAEHVDNPAVARRFLTEFRDLITLVETDKTEMDPGKTPQQLLTRLLCESRNSGVFAQPAYDIAVTCIPSADAWPFAGRLATCVLEPRREITEWIANWTLGLTRYAISSSSADWKRLIDLRATLFALLASDQHKALHDRIWQLLANAHQSLHYALHHSRLNDADRQKYRDVLIADLTQCETLLKTPRTMGEATHARRLWEWHLEHGQDEAMVAPARECEKLYSGLSPWRLHDFFRFDYDERLSVETDRVADILRNAKDQTVYLDFFEEVDRYLKSARGQSEDMADGMQLGALADRLADGFSLDAPGNPTALSAFVFAVLAAGDKAVPRTFAFAIMICRRRLAQLTSSGHVDTGEWLDRLVAMTPQKGAFLYRFYSNAHPQSTGQLTADDVKRILVHEHSFSSREWFWLLGVFAGAVDETLVDRIPALLEAAGDDRFEASNGLAAFVRSSHLTFRRYERQPSVTFVNALLGSIVKFHLNGTLLAFHDFEAMIKQSGVRPDMRYFASLMKSRVELEALPKTSDRIEILPHRFDVTAWCNFDPNNPEHVVAFQDVCRLALTSSFTGHYWIPKYLPLIDPSGESVAAFVTQAINGTEPANVDELSTLAYLASQYPMESEAWVMIARPICEKARELGREDREHLFFSLSRKESGVLTSMPGEVPLYYFQARDLARQLRDQEPLDSPLRSYREWALTRAEQDLQREEGRAEEHAHE